MAEKYQHMKTFITAALEYSGHPSEIVATVLQRSLGVIGVSLDLSVFDPGFSVASEFYVSLFNLMNNLPSGSTLIWNAVAVLQHACRNAAARHALSHTYKFTPILTKELKADLTVQKRVRILKLLQELTYGVKILWQEAHLPHLISTLTQWVSESTEKDVVALSLGVLVNLCYKNVPAIYALIRTVEIKVFTRTLMKIECSNINIRVHVCKFLMILDNVNNEISEEGVLDFTTVMFSSLVTALRGKDVLLMRHIVDFFNDVRENENTRGILITYPSYASDLNNILSTLESNADPECVALIMEYVSSLVKLQLPALVCLYPKCIKSAMTWVPAKQVCSKALALIRTVVCDLRRIQDFAEALEELDLSVLMLVLDSGDKLFGKSDVESQSTLTELLQLLQEMMTIPNLLPKVMKTFTEQMMRRVLGQILVEDQGRSPCEECSSEGLLQAQGTTLYVNAIYLMSQLASNDSGWQTLYTELLGRKQIQMVLALALFTGDIGAKQKALQVTTSVGFPKSCVSAVSHCMSELQSKMLVQGGLAATGISSGTGLHRAPSVQSHLGEKGPLFSPVQQERLETFICKLEDMINQNKIGDITASSVMELYEYKLAGMRHVERAKQASREAANNHATSLQPRLNQIIAESNGRHQLLYYTQQCLESTRNEKAALGSGIEEKEVQSSRSHAMQLQEAQGLKKIAAAKEAEIERMKCALEDCKKELDAREREVGALDRKLEEKESELKTIDSDVEELEIKINEHNILIQELEETNTKKQQLLEEKSQELALGEKEISALRQETKQQKDQSHDLECQIAEKDGRIKTIQGDLDELGDLMNNIFNLTKGK